MRRTIRVGTRGSALAATQTRWVADHLLACHSALSIVIETIHTLADRAGDVPLHQFSQRGVFVKEIEQALLVGEIDLAVHSLKDLPGENPPGLAIGAVPPREDPRDVLVVREPACPAPQLPLRAQAVVGSSSLRRRAQLGCLRPDLRFVDLRGNVDTRLRKLDRGDVDALALAAAGLARLGLARRVTCALPLEVCLPAPGQGALAVQCRADDHEVLGLVACLEDPATRACVTAERAFLAALGGGCSLPLGALGQIESGRLLLRGVVASPDGSRLLREAVWGDPADPAAAGQELAGRLLAAGAREILDDRTG